MKKFIRKLTRASSHSYSVNIPKEIVKNEKWKEKQKLDIVYDEKKNRVIIKDWIK